MQDYYTSKGKHLKESERQLIECWKNRDKLFNREIAYRLGKSPQTINNEIKRGTIQLKTKHKYSSKLAQANYTQHRGRSKRPTKLTVELDHKISQAVKEKVSLEVVHAYKGDNETPVVQDQILTMIAQKKRPMEAVQGTVDEEGFSSLLGKDTNSILKTLVANMDSDDGSIVNETHEIAESKQAYYISNFGKELNCEDHGRPSLDDNMNFIWTGLEDSKYLKKLPSKEKEVKKTDESKLVDIIETFELSDDGTMALFNLELFQESSHSPIEILESEEKYLTCVN